MEIRPLDSHREFDVFLGKGWDNWIRVKYTRNGCEVVSKSIQTNDETLELIFFKIKKKFFSQKKGVKQS